LCQFSVYDEKWELHENLMQGGVKGGRLVKGFTKACVAPAEATVLMKCVVSIQSPDGTWQF